MLVFQGVIYIAMVGKKRVFYSPPLLEPQKIHGAEERIATKSLVPSLQEWVGVGET